MDAESFTDLALRVIAREATDEERRALDAELAAAPAHRAKFEQLKIAHDVLRVTAPVTEAVQASTPVLPAHRVGELRTAVRQHFGPVANREKAALAADWRRAMRWLLGGAGAGALAFAVVLFFFANSQIEVGGYATDLQRGAGQPLMQVPAATFISFDKDEPFEQWQNAPLQWNERAKIWVDNEHDQLHIVRRASSGPTNEVQPLAPTDEAQREQIKQVVESLKK